MSNHIKTVGVVGAGALGLYYGGMLQRSGLEVRFLLRRDLAAIQQNGLHVHSVNGDFVLDTVAGFASPDEIGTVDLVIVGMKTFSNQYLLELVRPLLAEHTAILTLQNGLGNEELLAEAFGAERILGGVAFLGSNRGEPGHVHHLGAGKILLGEFSCGHSSRSQHLAQLFETAGVPCNAVNDLLHARWEKLVWNIPFNGLCALLQLDTKQLLARPELTQLARQIMLEVIAGANAQTHAEPIDGPAFSERMLLLTESLGHYQPSMMIDRNEGRPLELEAIYGIPLKRAEQAGVDMLRTAMLYDLLRAGETETG